MNPWLTVRALMARAARCVVLTKVTLLCPQPATIERNSLGEGVFSCPQTFQNNEKRKHFCFLKEGTGSDLSSRAVSSQVLSALESLTTVFGMGTGGTSPSLPPVDFQGWPAVTCFPSLVPLSFVRFPCSVLHLSASFPFRFASFRPLCFPSLSASLCFPSLSLRSSSCFRPCTSRCTLTTAQN